MTGVEVGVVQAIYRFPVKSMLGEALDRVTIDGGGVAGDRRYALVDDETGKVVSVKRPEVVGPNVRALGTNLQRHRGGPLP